MRFRRAIEAIILFSVICSVGIADSKNNWIMPNELKDISLGMTWKEVLQAREDVELFSIGPEDREKLSPTSDDPKEALMERFAPGSKFSTVFYHFDADAVLSLVSLVQSGKLNELNRKVFLNSIINKYGKPEDIHLQYSGVRYNGKMLWNKEHDIVVLAEIPTKVNEDGERAGLVLQIMTKKFKEYYDNLSETYPSKHQIPKNINTQELINSIWSEVNDILALNTNIEVRNDMTNYVIVILSVALIGGFYLLYRRLYKNRANRENKET